MAEGALARSEADLALGVTGFAGPAGVGREEGLVHFALARREGETVHREAHFGPIGRGPVRVQSLKIMLEMLEESVS
jgi:nicotinamide-nucleotide amidase